MYSGRQASSFVVTDSTAQPNSTNRNTVSRIESETLENTFKVCVFFKHIADLDYDEINFGTESETSYTYYITEEKLQECPRITIKIEKEDVSAILDKGCELTIMKENLCEQIKKRK